MNNNRLYLKNFLQINPFNKGMVNTLFLFIILMFSSLSFGQTNLDIDCSNNQCISPQLVTALNTCQTIINKSQCEAKVSGNLCQWIDDANPNGGYCTSLPQPKICSGYNCPPGETMSVIKMRGLLDLDLNILNNSGKPQNLGLIISNGEFPGKNANIAINGQNQTANGANVIMIGDNFNNLNVNLDGYNGQRGKHASEICADKIKAGDYGSVLQSYFNNRRATTSADPNRCDADDLNYMQTFNFTCDDPTFQEIPTNNPVVQVSQVKKLARCNAVASYSYCVKRKVVVSCNFRLWSSFRQQWIMDGSFLESPSFYKGPQSCSDGFQSCGMVYGNCSSSGFFPNVTYTPSYVYPVSGSYGNTTFNFNQCIYRAGGAGICGSSSSFNNIEGFYKTTVCTSSQVAGMPLTRGTSVGPFEEDFFNNEVNRLGGVDRFCDAYGQIPGKGNQAWWSGVPGAPGPAMGNIGGQSVETTGIPWEFMAESPPSKSAPAEPVGAILAWKNETASFGGYNPPTTNYVYSSTTSNSGGYSSTQNVYRWKTRSSYWKGYGSSVTYTSPGLNPDGLTLAPGSNWEVRQTNTFENCPGGWTNLKNVFINLVQYTNKENVSCSGITDPLDPNNRAFWQYTGISQEPTFGTEFVSCGIGSCAVNSTVSELSRSLDNISPGSGESGTEQGRGLLFVYDIKTLNARALPGGSGTVGNTDVVINPQTRICVKIDDANAGINTEQAKNPFVSFRRYQWQALKSTSGGNPGTPPRNTGKEVEVFKKIDPAARYLLDKSLL